MRLELLIMPLQLGTMLTSIDVLIETSLNKTTSGKLRQMKVKTEKNSAKVEEPDWNATDNKAGAVDQIKKKYGFSSAGVSINWLPANHLLTMHRVALIT